MGLLWVKVSNECCSSKRREALIEKSCDQMEIINDVVFPWIKVNVTRY